MISKGNFSDIGLDKMRDFNEANVAAYYFNLSRIPCSISSPFREDKHPSFSFYVCDGQVNYRDFASGESGSLWSLLKNIWNCTYEEVYNRVLQEMGTLKPVHPVIPQSKKAKALNVRIQGSVSLKCMIREWKDYDLKYWENYGISLEWLKFADVYPISHKIVMTDNGPITYKCDKYAYAFAEFKGGKCTLKIYQPFNKNGYKWSSSHKKSVISLWAKLPSSGLRVCICSSLKDALCLWANTGIPSIAPQGEGYMLSQTVIKELKQRFNQVFICFDNDPPGVRYAETLSSHTGFTNITIPFFEGGKDISDLYKLKGKDCFLQIFNKLFNSNLL